MRGGENGRQVIFSFTMKECRQKPEHRSAETKKKGEIVESKPYSHKRKPTPPTMKPARPMFGTSLFLSSYLSSGVEPTLVAPFKRGVPPAECVCRPMVPIFGILTLTKPLPLLGRPRIPFGNPWDAAPLVAGCCQPIVAPRLGPPPEAYIGALSLLAREFFLGIVRVLSPCAPVPVPGEDTLDKRPIASAW